MISWNCWKERGAPAVSMHLTKSSVPRFQACARARQNQQHMQILMHGGKSTRSMGLHCWTDAGVCVAPGVLSSEWWKVDAWPDLTWPLLLLLMVFQIDTHGFSPVKFDELNQQFFSYFFSFSLFNYIREKPSITTVPIASMARRTQTFPAFLVLASRVAVCSRKCRWLAGVDYIPL